MMTGEDIQNDIQRANYDDPEIYKAYEQLRRLHKSKGLPYRELVMSKTYGTFKYILMETYDEHGTVLITDMDTNQTYRFVDPQPAPNKRRALDQLVNR